MATATQLSKIAKDIQQIKMMAGAEPPGLPELVPHTAQQQVLDQAQRFNVLCCGRRWGKSELIQHLLVETTKGGWPTAYAVPTYRQATDAWANFLHKLGPMVASKNSVEKRIYLHNGGYIDVWSLSDQNAINRVRGKKYKRFVIDESAFVSRLKEALFLSIRPTLSDYKGDLWMASTPNGFNDYYEFFAYGQDPDRPNWASWQMPTVTNPHIDPDEVEQARQDMPSRQFKQEYLADFMATLSAGMFRREWFTMLESTPTEDIEAMPRGTGFVRVY